MYSQNAEESVINSLLGDNGRFLDVGAFDGKTFSNTLRLYERGWHGVLVEPSPKAFAALEQQYQNQNRAILIQAAIGTTNGYVDFWDSNGDAVSTTDTSHKEKWGKRPGCMFTKITVPTITFETLFAKYGANYDFVNIDTENTNLTILKVFPFSQCLPVCICVEHDGQAEAMQLILDPYGFRLMYQSGENCIWWRETK